MWCVDNIDIEIQRNERKTVGIQVFDIDNNPISLAGYVLDCRVRRSAGSGQVLVISPITMPNAQLGMIDVSFDGRNIPIGYGDQESLSLAYDITASDGLDVSVIIRGTLFLTPGVTY